MSALLPPDEEPTYPGPGVVLLGCEGCGVPELSRSLAGSHLVQLASTEAGEPSWRGRQVNFFDHEARYLLGEQWYMRRWPIRRGQRAVGMDGSGSYLQSPEAAARLAARLSPATTSLLVLLRDARLRMQHEGRPIRPNDMLEAALLRANDPLDATRDAIRHFFHNRTMALMRQPDEADLRAMMGDAKLDTAIAPPVLPRSSRPFYLSFEEAARRTTEVLVPKAVGGVPLSGDLLAAVVDSLTERINRNAPLSLQGAVGGLLQQQAEEAVGAARRVFRTAAGRRPLRTAALASPASLDLLIRNATQAALAEFAARAPSYGDGDAERNGWLQPYFDQLRTSLTASDSQLRQAQAHATRLAAVSAAERRLRAELDGRAKESQRGETQRATAQRQRLRELLANVAVLGVAACATLAPVGVLTRFAPLVRTAPTVLAGLGLWRVAQRALARWGHHLPHLEIPSPWVAKLDEATGDMGETLKAASWPHAASAAAA